MKLFIKQVVSKHEYTSWRATCFLYRQLNIYSIVTNGIAPHPWWRVSSKFPYLTRYVSQIMALIVGVNPKFHQRNFSSRSCKLCQTFCEDSVVHVLFQCPLLDDIRIQCWGDITGRMPIPMKDDVEKMTPQDKVIFILSCLGNTVVTDWELLYHGICIFVDRIYKMRSRLYDDMG